MLGWPKEPNISASAIMLASNEQWMGLPTT
jgi:hypothetical protein